MKKRAPDAIHPATKENFEGMNEILFTPTEREALRGEKANATIHGHQVLVAYQPDDDGYAGWLDGYRFIGVDHDPITGETFTEVFYFLSKRKTIVRFRAKPLDELIEKVVLQDGVPGMPEPLKPETLTHYWHHLHDASIEAYRSPASAMRDYLLDYYSRTGSHYIKQFLRISML